MLKGCGVPGFCVPCEILSHPKDERQRWTSLVFWGGNGVRRTAAQRLPRTQTSQSMSTPSTPAPRLLLDHQINHEDPTHWQH